MCTACLKASYPRRNPRKTKVSDVLAAAKDKFVKWLDQSLPEDFLQKSTLLRFECTLCGHVFKKTLKNIRHQCQKFGCSICAKEARIRKSIKAHRRIAKTRSVSPEYLHKIAAIYGYKWVGKVPPRIKSREKTGWECPRGHLWKASVRGFLTYDCKYCVWEDKHAAERARKHPTPRQVAASTALRRTEEDHHKLASLHGLEYVGGDLTKGDVNTRKVEWRCSQGHSWFTTYSCVLARQVHPSTFGKCPHCEGKRVNGVLVSYAQIELSEMLGAPMNEKVNGRFADCLLAKDRIAVEYDSWYFHSPKIPGKLASDRKRNKHIRDAGYKLLVVKANGGLPHPRVIYRALSKLRNTDASMHTVYTSEWKAGTTTVLDRKAR